MTVLDNDHITGSFVGLVNRCTTLLSWGLTKKKIYEKLLNEGFLYQDIFFSMCAAEIKLDDMSKQYKRNR